MKETHNRQEKKKIASYFKIFWWQASTWLIPTHWHCINVSSDWNKYWNGLHLNIFAIVFIWQVFIDSNALTVWKIAVRKYYVRDLEPYFSSGNDDSDLIQK